MNSIVSSLLVSLALSVVLTIILWFVFYGINIAKVGKEAYTKQSIWTSVGISVAVSVVLTLVLWGVFYGINQAIQAGKTKKESLNADDFVGSNDITQPTSNQTMNISNPPSTTRGFVVSV